MSDIDDFEIDEYIEYFEVCPICESFNSPMGQLGSKVHFTCRACGMWYSINYSTMKSGDSE